MEDEKKKQYRFYVNDKDRNRNELGFHSNKINTKKYNAVTFLPKALILQFARPANIYFLICAILQCIPVISPLGASTAIIPIVIVLSVSIIREGVEDCARARLDREQNNEGTGYYRNGSWFETTSGELNMGDIVDVIQDETFPADLILIDSSSEDGLCFIETGTLDGEKTLKAKQANKATAGKFRKEGDSPQEFIKIEGFKISGEAIADHPNPELYQLNGKMNLNFQPPNTDQAENLSFPLDAKQLLLKGAKLKNTSWVIGIVVYTGHNTKLMKNAKDPVTKYSSLERLMNIGLIIIFIIQAILCIISAILRGVYYKKNNLDEVNDNPSGFGFTKYSYGVESFLNYFTYLLLLNTLIPISLIITLEIVKLIQGAFMSCCCKCYSHVRKKWLDPNSVSLNEECGLVNYIFSDKTGTLTCNKMEFKYCVIGDVCYQYMRGRPEEESAKEKNFRNVENIMPFYEDEMYEAAKEGNKPINKSKYPGFIVKSEKDPSVSVNLEDSKDLIEHFWNALALCHSCEIQLNEEDQEEYICVSPDSIELVKSAKAQGWKLTDSGSPKIRRLKLGKDEDDTNDIDLLSLIEFTSDRKRETVIVKDRGIIKVYMKGADSVIQQKLGSGSMPQILSEGQNYVNKFSALGFRTLFVAMRVLSEEEFKTFEDAYTKASLEMDDRETKLAKVYEMIENNFYLLGTTIVEDKLQDNVPETISDLRMANIKVWMLTGDKLNTAENIGLSCNLISKSMKTFRVEGVEPKKNDKLEVINNQEREQKIIDFSKEFSKFKGEFDSKTKPQFGLLVDEKALLTINESEDCQKMFLDIAKDAVAVICCRVSPLQKSQVVKMMKQYKPDAITLAIGDGGNDVSMIMEAHIGVGIYGEEGMRAVQSSDYAIGEFQFLRPLLLYHGRTNYIRNAELIKYFFYKNFVFTLAHFFYGFYNNFTGQTIIDDWFITLFNLLFTSLPLGTRAVMDHDVKPEDGEIVNKMLPFLYEQNRDAPIFTILSFFLNLVTATAHCAINYFFIVYCLKSDSVNKAGQMAGLWYVSVNLFTNVLIIVSVNLFVYTKFHTWIHVAIFIVVTPLAYIVFLIIVHKWTFFNSVGTMMVAFRSGRLWMDLLFICGTCGFIDYFLLGAKFVLLPTDANVLQTLVKERGELREEKNLPRQIQEKLDRYKEFKVEDASLNPAESEKVKLNAKKKPEKEEDDNKHNESEAGLNPNNDINPNQTTDKLLGQGKEDYSEEDSENIGDEMKDTVKNPRVSQSIRIPNFLKNKKTNNSKNDEVDFNDPIENPRASRSKRIDKFFKIKKN